jgi:PAS domain S-box-containing protein
MAVRFILQLPGNKIKRMKNYKKQIYVFLYVSLFIVISSFTVLFFNFRKQVKLQNENLEIRKNIIQADSLTNNLLQIESDKRGFQLTSEVSYLKNFYKIKISSKGNISNLKKNTLDETNKNIISNIDSLFKLNIIIIDSGIVVFTTKGLDAAIEYMQRKDKRNILALLNQNLVLLKNNLMKKAEENTAHINKKSNSNLMGLLILVLIFILLMLVAARTFRRAQLKIIKNHMKFKEAQRIAKIGSWEWDITTNKINWSQEQYRLFGEDRESFVLTYENYLSHLPENEQENVKALIKDVLEGKTNYAVEHEIIRKDGTRLMVFEQGTVLYDNADNPIGMFGTTQDITENKKNEEKIKAERLLLRTVIDNIPDPIYIKDIEGRKIMANKTDMDFMGIGSEAEFISKTDLELFPTTGGMQGHQNDLAVIKAAKPVINNEEDFFDAKGNQRCLLTSKIPLLNAQGEITGLLGIGKDITHRKKAENELKEAQKKIQAIFDNTADGIYQSTIDGRFIMANPAMARIFGYESPDELIQSVTDIGTQIYADPAERNKMAELILAEGHVENNELQVLTKNKDIIWVNANIRIVRDDYGDIDYFEGTLQDITERKKAEDQLLILSNRLQLAIRATNIGIWDWDIVKDCIVWDEDMYRIYDVNSKENESIPKAWESAVHPEDLERVSGEVQMAIKGEKEYDTEFRIVHKDKTIHYVKGNALVLRDNSGTPLRMIGTNADITERKEAEEEILQLNKNLDQFANITAHDLQEPIRMVSGFLGLLYKKYNDIIDEEGKSYIYRAKDGADRMSVLIKDLLEFSRSGNKAAKKEPVDLGLVMDHVDRDLSIVMADANAIFRMPDSLPVVHGTQSALYRLFLNLVSNGLKFRKKDITPEIALSVFDINDYWEFKIQDNGIGIAEKDQPKLFQAFQRLHHRDEYPGTGLGLVTCKKIVETHGGKIWMTSELGKGTAFHFTINKMQNLLYQ